MFIVNGQERWERAVVFVFVSVLLAFNWYVWRGNQRRGDQEDLKEELQHGEG